MHEGSLVERLLDQVAALAAAQGAATQGAATQGDVVVSAIDVDIGPLAGVEPELVELAFARLAPERGMGHAELRIRLVPLVLHCLRCDARESLDCVAFRCPKCGHDRVRVEQGDAMILQSVTLDDVASGEMSAPTPSSAPEAWPAPEESP